MKCCKMTLSIIQRNVASGQQHCLRLGEKVVVKYCTNSINLSVTRHTHFFLTPDLNFLQFFENVKKSHVTDELIELVQYAGSLPLSVTVYAQGSAPIHMKLLLAVTSALNSSTGSCGLATMRFFPTLTFTRNLWARMLLSIQAMWNSSALWQETMENPSIILALLSAFLMSDNLFHLCVPPAFLIISSSAFLKNS